jgi:hypothetical protein
MSPWLFRKMVVLRKLEALEGEHGKRVEEVYTLLDQVESLGWRFVVGRGLILGMPMSLAPFVVTLLLDWQFHLLHKIGETGPFYLGMGETAMAMLAGVFLVRKWYGKNRATILETLKLEQKKPDFVNVMTTIQEIDPDIGKLVAKYMPKVE